MPLFLGICDVINVAFNFFLYSSPILSLSSLESFLFFLSLLPFSPKFISFLSFLNSFISLLHFLPPLFLPPPFRLLLSSPRSYILSFLLSFRPSFLPSDINAGNQRASCPPSKPFIGFSSNLINILDHLQIVLPPRHPPQLVPIPPPLPPPLPPLFLPLHLSTISFSSSLTCIQKSSKCTTEN